MIEQIIEGFVIFAAAGAHLYSLYRLDRHIEKQIREAVAGSAD